MYYRNILKKLSEWKNNITRKPLILRGARQVGKTTVVKMFSTEFDFFIHLNLDKNDDFKIFETNNNLETIIQILFLKQNIKPKENKTILIFIDEIQNSANAIKLLRYFYEEFNYLYVIAAGSLLETVLDNKISFPVGRVEYLILRPFSFEEFLLAKQETSALELYNLLPFAEYGHDKLLELFTEYCLIGGMPEIIKKYIEAKNITQVSKIFENLITTYLDDVEKYANNENQTKIIRHLIKNSFIIAGERIKFEGFANSNYKSKDVGDCFRILEKTFLLTLVYPTTNITIPLMENLHKSPKLHVLDTGIINKFASVQISILSNNLLDNVYEGKIAEHIVGQELLAIQTSVLSKNYFWTKESSQSNAEIDYVLQINSLLIPIEVKTGKTGRLRSLMEFIDLAPHNFAVRVYSGKFSIENCKTLKNKEFYLMNLPFYLVGKIYEYCNLLVNKLF